MSNFKNMKTIVLFIAIAFLLPLLCIFVMIFYTSEKNSILNFILFGIEAASPSIAAIGAIGISYGRKGTKAFLHVSFSPKMKTITFLPPILIAFAVMLTAKAIACLVMGTSFQINYPSAKKLIIIAWAFLAEEVGWRGFLHKKLMNAAPEFVVPFILGLIWSAWHYHFFMIGSIHVPILWFIIGCIADSYIYLFLLKLSRGNILIVMLYHMSGNLFINLFSINLDMNKGSAVPYIISVIITGLLGIGLYVFINRGWFRHFLSKKQFTPRPH